MFAAIASLWRTLPVIADVGWNRYLSPLPPPLNHRRALKGRGWIRNIPVPGKPSILYRKTINEQENLGHVSSSKQIGVATFCESPRLESRPDVTSLVGQLIQPSAAWFLLRALSLARELKPNKRNEKLQGFPVYTEAVILPDNFSKIHITAKTKRRNLKPIPLPAITPDP